MVVGVVVVGVVVVLVGLPIPLEGLLLSKFEKLFPAATLTLAESIVLLGDILASFLQDAINSEKTNAITNGERHQRYFSDF